MWTHQYIINATAAEKHDQTCLLFWAPPVREGKDNSIVIHPGSSANRATIEGCRQGQMSTYLEVILIFVCRLMESAVILAFH